MKLIFFFLASSALFTAVAIPMMTSFGNPSAPSAPQAPGPNHWQTPKVDFGSRMSKSDRTAARDLMIDHYNGLEPGNEKKQARLAYARDRWRDGQRPDDDHRQYLDFDYYRGDTLSSCKIGQRETIARDRPPPETHFGREVTDNHKPDLVKETNEKYKALPPDVARRVRSMKVQNDWAEGPGLREQTQITFHHGIRPMPKNTIGNPVTMYRPLSFLMGGNVPKDEITTIKKRIREEHDKLDENHPLKQANYGVVTDGWHKETGEKSRQVGATLYKVKDQLSFNGEEDFKKIGDFHVTLGKGQIANAQGISRATKRKLQASTSVPDVSTQP